MDFEIKWVTAAPAPDSIKIQYSVDAGSSWTTITDCTENDSVFNWSVPDLSSDSCLVKIAGVDCDPFDVSDDLFTITQSLVVDIDVDISTGCAPLRVQFENVTAGGMVDNWIWYFGDGRTGAERDPIHIYDHPGTYSVKLKAFSSTGVDSVVKESFIEVHESGTFAHLDLIDGTPTLPDHDWSKAIDGDTHGADGTVIINSEQPQAIFCVADSNGKKISAISLLCDTGIGHEERWIHRFQIAVSNSGIEDGDFQVVLDTVKIGGGAETFSFEPVNATFVKLVVLSPAEGMVQLGELQIFYQQSTPTMVADKNLLVPDKFALAQNYPNPFNPTTTIKFEVPQSCKIKVAVYNLLGEEIKTLINDSVAPGKYAVVWDGTNNSGTSVASGMYFYMLSSKEFRVIKKMILSK
jgi:PKD repeat protein